MNSAQRKPGHTGGLDYLQLGSTFLGRRITWFGGGWESHQTYMREALVCKMEDRDGKKGTGTGRVEDRGQGRTGFGRFSSMLRAALYRHGRNVLRRAWVLRLAIQKNRSSEVPEDTSDRRLEIQPARTFSHIRYTCMYSMQSFRNGGSGERRAHFRRNCVHVPNRN